MGSYPQSLWKERKKRALYMPSLSPQGKRKNGSMKPFKKTLKGEATPEEVFHKFSTFSEHTKYEQ